MHFLNGSLVAIPARPFFWQSRRHGLAPALIPQHGLMLLRHDWLSGEQTGLFPCYPCSYPVGHKEQVYVENSHTFL
jgi:hypothetical protein